MLYFIVHCWSTNENVDYKYLGKICGKYKFQELIYSKRKLFKVNPTSYTTEIVYEMFICLAVMRSWFIVEQVWKNILEQIQHSNLNMPPQLSIQKFPAGLSLALNTMKQKCRISFLMQLLLIHHHHHHQKKRLMMWMEKRRRFLFLFSSFLFFAFLFFFRICLSITCL